MKPVQPIQPVNHPCNDLQRGRSHYRDIHDAKHKVGSKQPAPDAFKKLLDNAMHQPDNK